MFPLAYLTDNAMAKVVRRFYFTRMVFDPETISPWDYWPSLSTLGSFKTVEYERTNHHLRTSFRVGRGQSWSSCAFSLKFPLEPIMLGCPCCAHVFFHKSAFFFNFVSGFCWWRWSRDRSKSTSCEGSWCSAAETFYAWNEIPHLAAILWCAQKQWVWVHQNLF